MEEFQALTILEKMVQITPVVVVVVPPLYLEVIPMVAAVVQVL